MAILIVILIIFGSGIGVLIFFVLKGVLQPKRISTLSEYVKTGKTAQAIKMAKHLLLKDSRNHEAHYFLGLAYLGENKNELALMEFKTVNQLGVFGGFLDEVLFRKKMAELFVKFEQDEEALKEYLLLIKLEPFEAEHFYQAGTIFEERAKTEQALKFYKKALEVQPHHSNAHLKLGMLLFRAKRGVEARQELETALKYNPENSLANYYLGKLQKESHDFNGALLSFERAQKDPDIKLRALVERGSCYMTQKNYERAIVELERASKLTSPEGDKEILFAQYFLSICYENTRQIEKAISEWEKIYARKPTFKDVAEKLSAYQDLRVDDKIKDYITSNRPQFLEICTRIATALGFSVRDSSELTKGVQLIVVENESDKWRNTKKMPKVMQFFRMSGNVDELPIRQVHDDLRKIGANRCIFITNTTFTRAALNYAETRPIDLIGKEKLQEIIKPLDLG